MQLVKSKQNYFITDEQKQERTQGTVVAKIDEIVEESIESIQPDVIIPT